VVDTYFDFESVVSRVLTTVLIGNTDVSTEVRDKVYHAELAEVNNPVFPCVCFKMWGNPPLFRGLQGAEYTLRIWSWAQSQVGASLLLAKVSAALEPRRFTDADKTFAIVFEPSVGGGVYVDTTGNVFGSVETYRVRAIARKSTERPFH